MAANKDRGVADDVLDQLLQGRDPATVFQSGGLVDELKKRLAERMLSGEMDHPLGVAAAEEAGNYRNGYRSKTVLTDTDKLELAIFARSARALRSGINREEPAAVCRLRRQDHCAARAWDDNARDRGVA